MKSSIVLDDPGGCQGLGNPLVEACGPLLDPADLVSRLMYLPPKPKAGTEVRRIAAELQSLWRIHIPSQSGVQVAQSIDTMLRTGYSHRRPSEAATWQRIYGVGVHPPAEAPILLGATVVGVSGTGKTAAVEHALRLYPQVVEHANLPHLVGPVRQIVWLKVDVPESGRIGDLAHSLMGATDEAIGAPRQAPVLAGRSSGVRLADLWLRRVSGHFLGILVLDELQNLFKIQTKAVRQVARNRGGERPMLRIVDDEALKFILTLMNRTKIPLMICCTSDGLAAINSRLSTAQRMVTGGFHPFLHAELPGDSFFSRRLLPTLLEYQWLPQKLRMSDELCRLMHSLTAGVPRICVALWHHSHQVAINQRLPGLTLDVICTAARGPMAPVQPAVQALLSGDPKRLELFEDLVG